MRRDAFDSRGRTHGIVLRLSPYRSARPGRREPRSRRFVTQTHALGVPAAKPRSLLIAGLIAAVLYVVGRRLSR